MAGPKAWTARVIPLGPQEIHLWLASTGGEATGRLPAAWALLDASERERADRFLVEHARTEYILSHGHVREVLAAHTGVDPRDFVFGKGPHGKPFIEEPASPVRVRFNLSHSRGVAACAVALGREIGVDVEEKSARVDVEGVARTVFSPAGLAAFAAVAPWQKRDHFFAKWTLKEALVKARGDGLTMDVQRIQVDLREDGALERMLLDGIDVSSIWYVCKFVPTPAHAGALVVEAGRGERLAIVEHGRAAA